MTQQMMPTRKEQVCKLTIPMTGFDPMEQFLLTDDPNKYDEEDTMEVVSITHLLRNKENPQRTEVKKKDLTVIAEDLQSLADSWNR